MPLPSLAPSRRHEGREGTREPAAPHLWRDDAAIRVAELQALVDAAGRAAILPLVGGIDLAAIFWTTTHRLEALVYGLALAALAAVALLACRLVAARKLRASTAWIGFGLATVLAGAVGLAWGVSFVLLYPDADAEHRLVLIAVLAAALAEGRPLMATRRVGLAYIVPASGGGCIGFMMGGAATDIGLGLLALLYGWHLVASGLASARVSAQGIADGLRVVEQQQTIDTLLLDFDEASSDWLWRTDADGRLVGTSEGIDAAAARLLAATEGEPLAVIFTRRGARPNDGASTILAALAARRPFRDRLVEIETDRETRWWRLSGKPLVDEAGRFGGYIGVGSDVSGARNSESRIAYLANFDALTGFANRTHFQAFATRQCALDLADGRNQGLLCLDLDGFKIVNDSIGHDGGDEILKQVSARLTSIVPADAFIARLGGDEFGIWLPSTTPAKAEDLARAIVATLGAPYDVDGLQTDIGASIGIALTPRHATTLEELRVRADLALYHAKAGGRGRACVFEPAFETALIERRKLERDLKLALARGEFLLHYQPLVDLTDGRVASFEALIRWQSPERGFVSPAAFIPAAESSGLIVAIGRWVLFEACRAAAAWPEQVRVAVNVSPPHVRAADFLQDVTMALKTSGLHPSRLEIEVTEGVFLDRSDAAMAALQTLRVQGVTVALDDFGTGYSSLNYLVNLPVDKIKIDRSFVTELSTSPAHQAVVDAILGLARKLSIRVTAEGIETKEQARALKMRRCDHLQGYLFSKPRPLAEVPEMIAIVPARFREAVPSHIASPLAMALAARQQGAGQAA